MWFQRVVNARDGFPGFWMCPTPNCDGAGFCFDIFPTDPSHPANEGWVEDDDDDEASDEADPDWQAEYEELAAAAIDNADSAEDWDPEEPKYKALDQEFGDTDDDDIEGEEWKYGLEPGERPPEPEWASKARREWEEEQKKYDMPDQRPRELDWSDREDAAPYKGTGNGGEFTEDDIPF
jgi:hypothetical protein